MFRVLFVVFVDRFFWFVEGFFFLFLGRVFFVCFLTFIFL